MDWKLWLKGLVSAAIGGAANSVGMVVADPNLMDVDGGMGKIGTVSLFGAVISVVMYLKQSPLP